MTDPALMQLGVGGVGVVVTLQMIQIGIPLIVRRMDASNGSAAIKMQQQVRDLHVWHSPEDNDGIKRWYFPRGLIESIDKLSDNIEKQTVILNSLKERFDMLKL